MKGKQKTRSLGEMIKGLILIQQIYTPKGLSPRFPIPDSRFPTPYSLLPISLTFPNKPFPFPE
ncbi:MAG: hypothetical protein F6J98_34765 [Moorea sp. SIO4G2]|nr:hypothetical protein [Moorena sp. SIO4G2]